MQAIEVPALLPVIPTRFRSFGLHFLMSAFGGVGRFALKNAIGEVEIRGIENLQKGPALILMNHTNPFDPLLLCFFGRKPIHFFITEPYMKKSFRARVMIFFGQITKRKLMNDTLPIRTMKQWTALGSLVAMFPEGQFSWDGTGSPLQPGLRSLIHYLKVPIITVRLSGGNFLKPAWAKIVRRGKILIEIDSPKNYLGEAIEASISNRLKVSNDFKNYLNQNIRQTDLALGLATFFRFCPNCFAENKLLEVNNDLKCQSCQAHWQVTLDLRLKSVADQDSSETIADVWKKIRNHVQSLLKNQDAFRSLSLVSLYDCTQADWKHLEEGELKYEHGVVSMRKWSLKKSDILAITLDWGDFILIRTQRKRYALQMPAESRAIWEDVLRAF